MKAIMKTPQKGKVRAIVLTLAATAVLAGLASVNACRVSQFGFVKLDSITVTPANPVMAGGTNLQLKATGVYSDASTQDMTTLVNWAVSDSMVTVSASGVATAAQVAAPATCTITASGPGGISGSAFLTVKNAQLTAIAVSPASADIDGGTTTALTAMGTFANGSDTFLQDITSMATWSTSNDAIATVDAGTVTGVGGGTVAITASWGNIASNEAKITVSGKSLVSLDITPKDDIVQRMVGVFFTATGTFNDGSVEDLTQSVTWSTSDATIATIGSYNAYVPGMTVITHHLIGTATITAKLGNTTASTTLTTSATAPY